MSMTRDTLLGLSLAALCLVSPRLSAEGTTFYAKSTADWANVAWFSDAALKTPAEGTPGAEDTVRLGKGTVTIKEGDEVALHSLWLGAVSVSESCTVEQSGGTVTLGSTELPSTYEAKDGIPALYVGQQSGKGSSAIYNLRGGTLSAKEGFLYLGGASWTNQLNVHGGTLRAKGLRGSGNQEFVFSQKGGVVALGEGGLLVPSLGNTVGRSVAFSGGTLLAEADATMDMTKTKSGNVSFTGTPAFAALNGKTMTVKGTLSGSGTLRIGAAELFEETACDGTVDLSGATLAIAGVELMGGTVHLGTARGLSVAAAEGVAPEAYAVTLRLTAAEEANGIVTELLKVGETFDLSRLTLLGADGEAAAEGAVKRDGQGSLYWSREEFPEVAFTVPASWGLAEADLPQVAKAYAVSSDFSLYSSEGSAQTLNGRKAAVGQLRGADGATPSVFGGLKSNGTAATAAADVWMKVLDGSYTRLVGGSNKWASSGQKAVTTTGNRLIEMVGGTVKEIVGGDYGDGQAPSGGYTLTGNVAIRIAGTAKVTGSAFGGTLGQHNGASTIKGSTTLTVESLQDSTEGTASKYPYGYLVAGPAWGGNQSTKSTVTGNSALVVTLPQGEGNFVKHLVGGAISLGNNGNYTVKEAAAQTVQGSSSVLVEAADAVTFSGDVVGGGIATTQYGNKGKAVVGKDASVTLAGGTYTGRIVAGGDGACAEVGGTATLTLKGGDFSAATMLPGNADGKTTLAVACEATVKALTAFDEIDFTAEGAALTVTGTFALPAEGMVAVRLPEGSPAGTGIPLTLPEGMATEETMARLYAISGNRYYKVALAPEGGLVSADIEVVFSRPATQAWAEATLAFPGMKTLRPDGSLTLDGAAAYDVEAGGTIFSGVQVAGPTGKTISLYGGAIPNTDSSLGATVTELTKPIRLRVAGGDYDRIIGGSDAGSWNGGKTQPSLFKKDILVEMAGGRADYLSGGSYNDGDNQTYEGNLAVVLSGDAVVRGSAFGGGVSSHGYTNVFGTAEAPVELSVTVLNVQNDNSATAYYFSEKEGAGARVGAIVGGTVYGSAADSKLTVNGDTAVAVNLAEDAAGKAFAKQLVGGMWVPKATGDKATPPTANAIFTVTGQASVAVSAPAGTVFQKDITGGHWVEGSYTACPMVLGSSSVTLNGGVYEGTVTAGSVGGGTYKALTPATLTVGAKGAAFRGLVQGGRAADRLLTLEGTMTLDGGTLDLASFTRVSGEGSVALKAGTLEVGALRASEGFGLLKVSEAAAGTIAVTADLAEGTSVTLPLVGDGLTAEAFTVLTPGGKSVRIDSVEPLESGLTLSFVAFIPPLAAEGVQGEGAWADLDWRAGDGEAVEADLVAAWTGDRILTLAGDAAVTLGAPVVAKPLSIGGTGTLTLAAEGGRLTAETVTVGTDTVLEAGAATLSGVTVAEGKTLTVRDADTVSLTAQNAVKGGTLRVEGVAFERSAIYTADEAAPEIGAGATLRLKTQPNDKDRNAHAITLSGNGTLVLDGKDVLGWGATDAKVTKVAVIAKENAVIRSPSGTQTMRATFEMGGVSRLEVGDRREPEGGESKNFTFCRGSTIVAKDGTPSIEAIEGATSPAVALRCTTGGGGISDALKAFFFDVREGAAFTVNVPMVRMPRTDKASEIPASNYPVRKLGKGTLVLAKANVATDDLGANPLEVLEGTLRLVGEGAWDAPVALGGTLAGEGTGTSVASLTLGAGAALDASAGAVRVTGTVTLAEGVASVPVTLSAEAKAGDVVLACAEPSAEVAAALKAEGFAVAAEAGTGYVLKGTAPELPSPANPGVFDAATLQRLREAAAELGLREGFSVKALNMDGSEKGDAAFAAAVLACFDVEAFAADTEGNALTFSYAFGVSDVTADPKGEQVTVTASVEGASFRAGTTLRLVSAEEPSVTLAEAPVTASETPRRTLTLSFEMTQSCQLFRAQVVSEAEAE